VRRIRISKLLYNIKEGLRLLFNTFFRFGKFRKELRYGTEAGFGAEAVRGISWLDGVSRVEDRSG
jgi:hypothetical protein